MITPADSAPTAPEQMPVSTFNIQAPNSDSSAPASTIHGLDKSFDTGAPGTPMTLPAQDFSLPNAHQIGYTGDGNE